MPLWARRNRIRSVNPKGFGEGNALHKRFHASLLAACGSPRLIAACARLYDEAYRYRRLMMATFKSPSEFVRSQEILAEAAIERAAERAEALRPPSSSSANVASGILRIAPASWGNSRGTTTTGFFFRHERVNCRHDRREHPAFGSTRILRS